jgi:hypothetical protein
MLNCISRFSERDLLMRYHWGLGVGHIHAHQHTVPLAAIPRTDSPDVQLEHEPDATLDVNEINIQIDLQDGNSDVYHSDNPELGLEDRELEGWEDVESDGSEGGDEGGDGEGDEEDMEDD